MAAPPVSDIRLTNRRSFPAWYAELKINSTFRNVWHLVNPDAPEAPHLLSAEPPPPLTIDQMIEQSNIERNTPLAIWDADGRPEAEKGVRPRAPRPARFDDIKEEYSFRLKEYAVKQSNWSTQSSRYQNWDWVCRTVKPALLATTGSCTRKLDPQPTDEQLKDVRERLAKGYEKLRGQLEKKGWMKNGGKLPGDFEC